MHATSGIQTRNHRKRMALQVVEMSESFALSIHSFRLVTTEHTSKERGTGG